MPLRLIDPKQPIKWIHPSEHGKPDATVFHLVPLTEGQSRKLKAIYPTKLVEGEISISQEELLHDLFLSNVVQIDGVVWPGMDGPVSITSKEDRERFLQCIPAQYMTPVYAAMQNMSVLDEGTVKNSGESCGSPI